MSDRILILANNSNGLYSFRRELIKKLSRKYTVVASTPFDMNTDELKLSGCRLIRTEFDSRSMNPVKDIKLAVYGQNVLVIKDCRYRAIKITLF